MSRVYVGRISYQVREKDVERFFRGFGRIKDINLKNGFGFVEFDDPRDADDAVYECNGRELMGERYGPPTRTEHRLHVENISSRDLKDFMRQAGDITYADAHKTRVGEGTVEYASREDVKNALRKLDGADLNGRKLRLTEDRGGHSRHRSRSRSGSRDRRRSESRSRSRSRSRDRGRSRSPDSKSPGDDKRGRSRSRSRSKDGSETRRSRSRSKSPVDRATETGKDERASRSRSRSRSPEKERPRSKSPDKRKSGSPAQDEMRSGSPSPTPVAKDNGPEE
ncbi:Serine/arginine-rich splicing factor 4 [Geodia barretti]|uniref:Serine/arginine-rich splicing factor 4 n=1 Tax=Geodia barretti TaxID=519541 RepID=A0AA35X9K7_GEOBA|nr:Serine/arginine-rich splicing factor 4 [Geodia barretti]